MPTFAGHSFLIVNRPLLREAGPLLALDDVPVRGLLESVQSFHKQRAGLMLIEGEEALVSLLHPGGHCLAPRAYRAFILLRRPVGIKKIEAGSDGAFVQKMKEPMLSGSDSGIFTQCSIKEQKGKNAPS